MRLYGNLKLGRNIFLILGFASAVLVALFLAGCGGGDSTTSAVATAPQCKADAPSIIPPSSGKPQHVYFFRDT